MKGFNLSTYYYTHRGISLLVIVALILVLSLVSYYNFSVYRFQDGQLQTYRSQVSDVSNELKGVKTKLTQLVRGKEEMLEKSRIKKFSKRTEKINRIIERKSFSWSEFMYSLEEITPRDISIAKIRPDYDAKKIRISGVAKGFEKITLFVDKLPESNYVNKSFLLSESAMLVDKTFPAIAFEIEAEGEF